MKMQRPNNSSVLTRRTLLAVALAGAALAGAVPAVRAQKAEFTLADVMALLAQRKSGEARFTEERFVSTFSDPLRSSGTLSFTAPDRFVRQTLEPRPESMEVQGNNLVLKRGGRTRQLALDAIPEVAALVEAVRGTLSGNAAALQKYFRVAVSGQAGKWVLVLTPIDNKLLAQVMQIEIVGQNADLRSIALALGGGDRSLMLIDAPSK